MEFLNVHYFDFMLLTKSASYRNTVLAVIFNKFFIKCFRLASSLGTLCHGLD